MKTPPTPIQEIRSPAVEKAGVQLWIKREDLNHPVISGNKFRKLYYNLQKAKETGKQTLLTFGGAYSNHIYAVAGAGKAFGFNTIGVIRGEPHAPLNPTLAFAKSCGMTLHYMDRASYRRKTEKPVIDQLMQQFGDCYLIPEGGTNALALKGCAELVGNIQMPFDYLCCPVGTGGTMAGLVTGLQGKKKALGFAALKGHFLKDTVKGLLAESSAATFDNWEICSDYHFGGYAKVKPALMDFIYSFNNDHKIELEPIYTGKMMYGILDLIQKGRFPRGSTVMAIHTGGLQGNTGFSEGL